MPRFAVVLLYLLLCSLSFSCVEFQVFIIVASDIGATGVTAFIENAVEFFMWHLKSYAVRPFAVGVMQRTCSNDFSFSRHRYGTDKQEDGFPEGGAVIFGTGIFHVNYR